MKRITIWKIAAVFALLVIVAAAAIRYNADLTAERQEEEALVPAVVTTYFDGTQDNPDERMKKDEEADLGTEDNPLVIVEIVPKESLAEIGYLIPGCEPVSMEALLYDPLYTTYLSRLGSVASRNETYTEEMDDKWPEQLEAGARINGNEADWPKEVSNPGVEFVNDSNDSWSRVNIGDWDETNAKSGYYEKVKEGETGNFTLKYELRWQAGGDYKLVGWNNNYTNEPEWDGCSAPDAIWRYNAYYQKVEAGTGDYVVVPTGVVMKLGGEYRWVDAENTENIVTDYTADRIWSRRKGDYYHYYKKTTYASWEHTDTMIKEIFGEEVSADDICKEVITITPYDLRNPNNLSLLTYADMIYMHGGHSQGNKTNSLEEIWTKFNTKGENGSVKKLTAEEDGRDTFAKNDIPWNAAIEIVERMAGENPAALIMDAQVNVGDQSATDNNCRKLCLMIRQYGPVMFKTAFLDTGLVTESGEDRLNTCGLTTGIYNNESMWDMNTLLPKNMSREDMNAQYGITNPDYSAHWDTVTDNTYIYSGDKGMLDDYTANAIGENDYNREAFDYYEDITGERPGQLTTNQIVRYLMQDHLTKRAVKILEVQPCNKFIYGNNEWESYYAGSKYNYTNWEEYYALVLPWLKGDWDKTLVVDKMTTAQFNSCITDLNSEYDAIIFGMQQDISNGAEGYNDSNMNTYNGSTRTASLGYTGIGDMVSSGMKEVRKVVTDDTLRYSGTDITEKKYEELLSFMSGGKPVILDRAFLDSSRNVNRQLVDASSNMYKLAVQYNYNMSASSQPNLFVRGLYQANRLKRVLAYENCRIRFVKVDDTNPGYPAEYTYEAENALITKTKYEPRKINNKWLMTQTSVTQNYSLYGAIKEGSVTYADRNFVYTFKIVGKVGQTYGIDLYIDMDGDGVYDGSLKETDQTKSEKVSGIVVRDRRTNQVVDAQKLQPNREYVLVKYMEGNYKGMQPWKLEAHMTTGSGNTNCRSSVIKYSALKCNSAQEKTKIRVLLMDLTPDMSEPEDYFSANYDYAAKSVIRMDLMEEFTEYLDRVDEFDFELRYMSNTEWKTNYGSSVEAWENELDNYDMMILGFHDDCTYTDNEVFHEGFEYFVSCGKGAILSHDMIRDKSPDANKNIPKKLGVQFDEDLRQLMAQRRYRTSYVELNGGESNGGTRVNLVSDNATNRQYAVQAQGEALNEPDAQEGLWPGIYDNSTHLLWMLGSRDRADRDTFSNPNPNTWGSSVSADNYANGMLTRYVNIINQGQITNYPYKIPSLISVAQTHTQNYQLDMDKDGLVVWYGLTDEFSSDFQEEMIQKYSGNTYEKKQEAYYNDLLRKAGVSTKTSKNWTLEQKQQEVQKYLDHGVYSSIESDGRNSYYIYNVGNITYTGLGHSTNMSQEEIQLFVNTMVASYRSAAAVPKIVVTNEDAVVNEDETVLYVDIDEENAIPQEDQMLQVKFKVVDPSVTEVAGRSFSLEYVSRQAVDTYTLEDAAQTPLPRYTKTKVRSGKTVEAEVADVNTESEYCFYVPYAEVKANGKAEYILELDSSYYNSSNKLITSSKRTRIVVMQMPLFRLN